MQENHGLSKIPKENIWTIYTKHVFKGFILCHVVIDWEHLKNAPDDRSKVGYTLFHRGSFAAMHPSLEL